MKYLNYAHIRFPVRFLNRKFNAKILTDYHKIQTCLCVKLIQLSIKYMAKFFH